MEHEHEWQFASYMADCLIEECPHCNFELWTYYEDKEVVKEAIINTEDGKYKLVEVQFLHDKYKEENYGTNSK